MIVILMGVCGSGKTSVGLSLASKLGWQFEDADRHHSDNNVSKMSRGDPLTDEDRWPWLQSLHQILMKSVACGYWIILFFSHRWYKCNQDGVLACSALRQTYRTVLLTGNKSEPTSELADHCLLVLLHGPADTLAKRLTGRKGHFMPASMLESQLSQLEIPDDKEQCLQCDITNPVDQIVSQIIDRIKSRNTLCTT